MMKEVREEDERGEGVPWPMGEEWVSYVIGGKGGEKEKWRVDKSRINGLKNDGVGDLGDRLESANDDEQCKKKANYKYIFNIKGLEAR